MARPSYEGVGQAIAAVRSNAKFTQTHLAELLRANGWPVDQSRLSKWERGVEAPSDIDLFPALERLCGAPVGTILRRAGYVVDDGRGLDVVQAIMADDRLSMVTKQILVDAYESAIRRSAAAAKA